MSLKGNYEKALEGYQDGVFWTAERKQHLIFNHTHNKNVSSLGLRAACIDDGAFYAKSWVRGSPACTASML